MSTDTYGRRPVRHTRVTSPFVSGIRVPQMSSHPLCHNFINVFTCVLIGEHFPSLLPSSSFFPLCFTILILYLITLSPYWGSVSTSFLTLDFFRSSLIWISSLSFVDVSPCPHPKYETPTSLTHLKVLTTVDYTPCRTCWLYCKVWDVSSFWSKVNFLDLRLKWSSVTVFLFVH